MAQHNFTDELSHRALDTIDSVVAVVNDKAIRPAIVAARAIVFGVIIAVVALAVVVLLSVGFIRLTTDYLFHYRVWVSYLVLGAIFSDTLISNIRHALGHVTLPSGFSPTGGVSPAQLKALPAPVRHVLVVGYAHSLQTVFLVAVPIALVAFALTWLLPEVPLRRTTGRSLAK